ncbi:MAG: hypothetical protein COA58_12770 [Bacteroidetes bacterium]|nr:MAG: hypothetical protein COA58_12770 [Bacteroidota bacterium]
MHSIEPFFLWRDFYLSDQDPNALNYGLEYSEFNYTNQVYNYLLHPQWDDFGSDTLFYKLLYADYDEKFCVIELIGEWNDAISNDIMVLKTELIDHLIDLGIENFAIIAENVLNFHAGDDDYYQEWKDDIGGGIYIINALPHVLEEMESIRLQHYITFGGRLNDISWRGIKPDQLLELLETQYLDI